MVAAIKQTQEERDNERTALYALGFFWSPDRHVYLDANLDLVPPRLIRSWVDQAIERTSERMARLTQRYIAGRIDFPTWRVAVQAELKAMHTGLAQIAIGGTEQWGPAQAGRLGARLRFLYGKLNSLGLEVEHGSVSDAELLNRIAMAVESGRGTFEGMRRGLMFDAGMSEEQRVLGAAAHCTDCPPLSGYWAPIGSLPGIGDSLCLSNCACTFTYRDAMGVEAEG